jgi:L-alanine-DL-glutamate epimerase-like enolase superfamily enzyme
MKIAHLEFIPVSIPYTRREISSQVSRDGVTDVLVKATSNDGLVGWGESCSGADVESVVETLKAMAPFVVGRDPWESEAIRAELWQRGLWIFRKPTASFAYAGIDMALWDMCGKVARVPLYKLLGGRVRDKVNYFYYLSRGTSSEIMAQCREGMERGYSVFYLKVGVDIEAELQMVEALREAAGPKAKIRLDANGAWKVKEALKNIARLEKYRIDFVEQPVVQDPPDNMYEVRSNCSVAICQNEGLWSAEDAYRNITGRTADVYSFSPYWVGSLKAFQHLAEVAAFEGLEVCRHTHGEFGIAAAACHHVSLTLSNLVDGNQQTAQIMSGDVLKDALPIARGPHWGIPEGVGLCVDVDERQVSRFNELYRQRGQFLPYDPGQIGKEL